MSVQARTSAPTYTPRVSPASIASPDLGQLLDGRYRVEELVARGGMASVHRGHDERLERTVALKLMHPHLASDPQFRSRFTREARAAARLTHPDVVAVYDHGEDGDHAYLAMELIDGGTLREELRRGPLTVRRALAIAIPVARALRAAHEAGIVHRDIKPENILLASDGRVKVTDFGLARAIGAASASATGTLLGTVAYVSPEVVMRGHCDERSDLYSFGIVLFEMLTGCQPFTGEQPVHVAFQHVHEDIPAPSSLVPTVPRELDSLVTWCCARSAASRPASADELLRALVELSDHLPASVQDARPTTARSTQDVPLLTSPMPEDALDHDSGPRIFPTGAVPAADAAAPAEPAAANAPGSGHDGSSPRSASAAAEPAEPDEDASLRLVAVRPPRPRSGRHLGRGAARRSFALRALAVAAALALVLGGAWAGFRWYGTEGPGGDRTVPVVAGTTLSDAEAALEGADLTAETRETYSDTVPAGHVIGSTPTPGSELKRGDAVTLLVSRGVQTFPVPGVQGKTVDEARAAVEGAGLVLVEDERVYDEKVPEGAIVSQSAEADALPAGGEVHVVVSRGPRPISVPETTGRAEADAVAALKDQGFLVKTSQAYSLTVPAGSVISQDPAGGTARRGATIDVVVSQGPEMVAVPDVFKMPEADAVTTLQNAGFVVEVAHDKGEPVFGQVYQQSLAGGTQAGKGSTITISVF